MARKPIARVGQQVIVEGIENPLEVLEIALAKDVVEVVLPVGAKKRRTYGGAKYAYRLRLKTVKPKWFLEYEIVYVVEYTPLVMEISRHVELIESLGGYEMLRDYLHRLPHSKRDSYKVRELIRLVEYAALLAEGTSQERVDAEAEIISIMQ